MTFHALKSCSEEAKILLGVIWKAFKVSQLHFSPRLLGWTSGISAFSNLESPDNQWWDRVLSRLSFLGKSNWAWPILRWDFQKSTIAGSTIIKETWNCSMEASALQLHVWIHPYGSSPASILWQICHIPSVIFLFPYSSFDGYIVPWCFIYAFLFLCKNPTVFEN